MSQVWARDLDIRYSYFLADFVPRRFAHPGPVWPGKAELRYNFPTLSLMTFKGK